MAGSQGVEVDLDDASIDEELQARLERIGIRNPKPDSESGDSATSIRSIPLGNIEGIFENGRRYANRSYFLPNDEAEETRSSITHQIYLTALSGNLTFHRVRPGTSRVLDIGSGPGDWAIAMAEQFPRSEIVATDIWPFQPAGIPPNLIYEIDDARLEWDFPNKFEYVHIRGLAGAFEDWSKVYKQVYESCADDGVVELADMSLVKYETIESDTALERYNEALREAAEGAGISFDLGHLKEAVIQAVGFRIFRKVSIEIPVGQWNTDPQKKSLGKLALVAVLEGLEAQAMRLFTTYINWSTEEVLALCKEVKEEIIGGGQRPAITCQIVVAKRIPIQE